MVFGAIDCPTRGVDDFRETLRVREAKLANAKKQRDTILIDMRKASAAADTGDQRARFELTGLNKSHVSIGRLILSLEAEVAEARKRLGMAMNQAATVEAKRAQQDGLREEAVKWFEVRTPDGRLVRHRAVSLDALRKSLLPNYVCVAEVFGASDQGLGGFAVSISPGAKSTMSGLLAAHGDELLAWLAGHGVKSTAA